MFMTVFFAMTQTCNLSRCLSVSEQLNKLQDIRIMEFNSTIKKEWAVYLHNNLDETTENYVEWEKLITEGYMMYVHISITSVKYKIIKTEHKWTIIRD